MTARRLHYWLGLTLAAPLFLWASSGFIGALPRGGGSGVRYEKLELGRLRIGPSEAVSLAGVPGVSSMTLEQRDGRLSWQLVAGARAWRVDGESGAVSEVVSGGAQRYFSEAHFFFVAGPLQQPLLLGGSLGLLGLLGSGLWLARRRWSR